jgi:hypothetical protein
LDVEIDPAWSQGSLIDPNALIEAVPGIEIKPNDIVIVISQDCDVVSRSLDAEPLLDIHLARFIDELDGNFTAGKNPRIFDFEDTAVDDTMQRYRCRDANRRRINRTILVGTIPVGKLTEQNTRQLAQWTARRFTRAALPNEFNRRLLNARTQLARIAKSAGHSLSAIYVGLSTRTELPPADSYRVILVGSIRSSESIAEATEAVSKIAALLGALPGIELEDDDVRLEDDISLADIRQLLRLDFDYISVRGGEEPAPDS